MSGHSKWAQTKHQKAAADARRSNLFTKLANAITITARQGGDPMMNYRLRLAVERAKAASMPKGNIERAIKRGTGVLGGAQIEEVTYEIYGPGGTAVLVEAATDNKNRTSAEIKAALAKFGGKLASPGAVSYLFEQKGEIKVSNQLPEQKLPATEQTELIILDSGADDYTKVQNGFLVWTKPGELNAVKENLEAKGATVDSFEIVSTPKTTIEVPEEDSEKVIKLLEALDELDDVTAVSSNLG